MREIMVSFTTARDIGQEAYWAGKMIHSIVYTPSTENPGTTYQGCVG